MLSSSQIIVIRADASANIGTGHIMRCLALAQAWKEKGGEAIFVMCINSPALEARLISEGVKIVHLKVMLGSIDDAMQTASLAQDLSSPWVVIDGYHFGSEYQKILKDSGLCLLFIDDNGHADHYYSDIVLNQNSHANEGLYENREPHTRLLLGTRYILLRREFWPWRGWKRKVPETARKVLVTLGGSDLDNITQKVINVLCQLDFNRLDVIIVMGSNNPNYEKLRIYLESSKIPFRIETNISNMAKLMAWADAAISSGGTTSWELAFMGLPNLVIILAENQVKVAEQLETIGVAINLGWHNCLNYQTIQKQVNTLLTKAEIRTSMASHGNELVDGLGANRVVAFLRSRTIRLRQASEDDCKLIYHWANDRDSRAASFSTGWIPWEEHILWFENIIRAKNCVFFIALDGQGQPIGQVRFDLDGHDAVVSMSIDRGKRGCGLSSLIIIRAVEEIFRRQSASRINAFIKPHNKHSLRAFEVAGFSKVGQKIIKGCEALHYVRVR